MSTGSLSASPADAVAEQGLVWLKFEGALERQFLIDGAADRLRHACISGLISLLVFDAFLGVDYLMAPDVFWLALTLRLGVFTPVALAILAFGWLCRAWVLRSLSPIWMEIIVVASGVSAAASLAYILSASHSPTSQYYHVGLMVVITYGNLVQRLRFWYALVFSLAVLAMHVGGITMVPAFDEHLILPEVALMAATVAFTLMSNYAMERDERKQYLLARRRKQLLTELQAVNTQLNVLSRVDPLTGLYNRRHFRAHLDKLWGRAQADGHLVSILMVDVDHFKKFNDHYGHGHGDHCLAQVAQAIQGALRQSVDTLARYGGEEFIAVLPLTSGPDAYAVAERVRQAVLSLGMPHALTAMHQLVTVSVGVATVNAKLGVSVDALIGQADGALYAAKRSGRNRVAQVVMT
jgi:diguanylate cyclase (GGDEF)-like protein